MGLSEASFPRGRRDDCFYSAAERREFLRKEGSGLAPSTPQQDEMLLFYSIVTRARRRLTLSYASVSSSGQPLFPSPYVTAVQDLFCPTAIKPSAHSDLDPVPSRDRILSSVDLRLVATDELRSGRPGLFRAMADGPSRGAAARGILAAADMDACRFEQQGFTPFEGLLQHASSVTRLAEKYSPDYQFSATQLERYATCPFRFLLSEVLHLEPNDPIEPEIDPRRRGLSLHRVLADLHRSPAGPRSSAQPDGAELIEVLRRLVATQFAVAAELPAYERALQAAELNFAERFVELYSQQWEEYLAAVGDGWDELPAPRFVELAFGDVPNWDEPTPSDKTPLPFVTFGTPDSPVRVRGRIDRIDVGRRGGREAFSVIDYKTRSGPRFMLADVELGRALQLAIYASAARRSGILDPDASVFQMAYWSLTLTGCVVGLKGKSKELEMLDPQLVGDIERTLHEVLPKIAQRLRAGQFPVINSDPDCGKWCPYSTACRVGQVRSLQIERKKLWGLSQR
jgi:ATP-dependent helicase/nuclease subunit B